MAGLSKNRGVNLEGFTPEFKKSMPLFGELDGPILDAPCGFGRHALSLREIGCRVTCVDIDDEALQHLTNLRRNYSHDRQGQLDIIKLDLRNDAWPFNESQFIGALNIHFFRPALVTNIACSLQPGGLLYIETISNRKGNYTELPKAGEVQSLLAGAVEYLHFRERAAGPAGSEKVTVRMLARKN